MVLTCHKYVDVNGTDYSGKVISVDADRKLSDIGLCNVVISNKGGQYKTTFAEMQRVAVAQARAAFHAQSDFFTGADGASPAAKWAAHLNGGSVTIQGNKLRVLGSDPNNNGVRYTTGITPPLTAAFLVKSTSDVANCLLIAGQNSAAATRWYVVNTVDYRFKTNRYIGGGFEGLQDWIAFSKDTWYRFVVRQTSTSSVTLEVYDVFGVQLGTRTLAHDAVDVFKLDIYTFGGNYVYVDSHLAWADANQRGEQVFEGVIDKIEFNHSPETITFHCVDDARELTKQYDETYGQATTTFTPSYGATDDVAALTSALLTSGWTYTAPDCAIHDNQTVSINTRRDQALNELLVLTPYLGWYVLPMKHFCWVMPDVSPACDAWTESNANWTDLGDAGGILEDAVNEVDGSKALYSTTIHILTTIGGRRGDALNINIGNYSLLVIYYGCVKITGGSYNIRLWTDVAGGKYWTLNIPNIYNEFNGPEDFVHVVLRLPDSIGNHGWTATNTPSGNVQRLDIYAQSNALNPYSHNLYWDVLYFCAPKRLTSKYTITNIISVRHLKDANQYTKTIVTGTGVSASASDATAITQYGQNEILIDDRSITGSEECLGVAQTLLNAEGWDESAAPITVEVVNPGDMYNLMLGDTVTITYANMNLSSATRTVIRRCDTLDNGGWRTILTLGCDPTRDKLTQIWSAAKRKRYG